MPKTLQRCCIDNSFVTLGRAPLADAETAGGQKRNFLIDVSYLLSCFVLEMFLESCMLKLFHVLTFHFHVLLKKTQNTSPQLCDLGLKF